MEFLGWTSLRCIGHCRKDLVCDMVPGKTNSGASAADGWYICRSCFKELKLSLDDIPDFVPHEDQLRHESEIKWRQEIR
jgi:hypothetical protein